MRCPPERRTRRHVLGAARTRRGEPWRSPVAIRASGRPHAALRPPVTTVAHGTRSESPAISGPMIRSPLPAWIALYLNVLPFLGTSVLPIPHSLGQALAQGMLLVALALALLANPTLALRPNIFLTLLTALAVLALMVSIHNQFVVGSTYRAV